MTKAEKAIKILHGMKADNLNLDDLYTKDKYEALSMAIEALEMLEQKSKTEGIKLVINIPAYVKEQADTGKGEELGIPTWLVYEIANGIPLPKGHGDLVDRNDLLADSYCIDDWSGNEVNIVDVMTVKMAESIIEADKIERRVEE